MAGFADYDFGDDAYPDALCRPPEPEPAKQGRLTALLWDGWLRASDWLAGRSVRWAVAEAEWTLAGGWYARHRRAADLRRVAGVARG